MLDNNLVIYLIAGFGSVVLSLLATPVVRHLAHKWGFVDRPDGQRKMQRKAVALGGGASLLVAMAGALAMAYAYSVSQGLALLGPSKAFSLTCMAIGAVGIVALGLVDDFVGLRGRQKLLGQLAIVAVLIYSGVRIEQFGFFGSIVSLGMFAIPATLFWLVGTTNAVNLIDGIDGLASSVGFILCLTVAAISGWQGFVVETAIMLALAGAQLGFLRYNFAPASIYLGDAGSMLIGLMCGVVAVQSNAKSTAAMAFAVPLAVWMVPILDSFAAIVRRKLTGRSLFAPDRGHLHHSLLVRGWTVRQASLFIALICATTCLSAVLSFCLKDDKFAIMTVLAVMAFLIFTKTFGHIEFALLTHRMRRLASSIIRSEAYNARRLRESCIQLQGSRQWGKLWTAVVESAENLEMVRIQLTINIPAMHESFFATWECPKEERPLSDRSWHTSHPLTIDGDVVGKLDVVGRIKPGATIPQVIQVLEFLEPIEENIRQIRESLDVEPTLVNEAVTSTSIPPLMPPTATPVASTPSQGVFLAK